MNQYDIYKPLDSTPISKEQKYETLRTHLIENITHNYVTEETKMRVIENSNISTAKINLLARPSKPKEVKKPKKVMRRPMQINQLKKEFNHLNGELLTQMNQLWENYIDKIIGNNNLNALISSELIGAKMEVVESKNLALVGKKGICVVETKNVFVIAHCNTLTEEKVNEKKNVQIIILPKNVVNVKLIYREKEYLLYGKNWMIRPSERFENKQFKDVRTIDLK